MSEPKSRPSAPSVRVRCEEHRVSYSTGTSTGCPACLARAAREEPEERMAVSPFRMAAIVVVGVGAYFLMNRSFDAIAQDAASSDETIAQVAGKLNPNTYQAEIQALERALYASGPEFSQGSALGTAASELSKAIQPTSGGNPFKRARLRQHAATILLFGTAVEEKQDVGYAAFDGSMARSEWESIRHDVFSGADWFQKSEAVASAPPPTQAAARPSIGRRAILDLALDLENLMRFSTSALRRVGEPANSYGSPEARRLKTTWDETRMAMSDRLTTISAALPNGKVGLRPSEHYAHQYLEQAAREFHNLAMLQHVPSTPERQFLLEKARHFLDEAERSLVDDNSGI